MNQSGETKNNAELQKAFAELKDSLRHTVDPANDQAPKLGGAAFDAPPATIRPAAPGISPDARTQTRATHGSESKNPAIAETGRRRKLLYLSAAVVISGLAALGWTLTRGHGTNDPEIEAAATPQTDVVDTSAAASADADASTPVETAATAPDAPPSEAARTEPAPAQSPEAESAAAPQAPVPTETATATQTQVAEPPKAAGTEAEATQPTAQQAAKPTIAAPAIPAPSGTAAPAKQAALSPATAAPETEAAKPAVVKPKPARPKAVAKPKPATQAARRPVADPTPVAPPPAPVAAEAPPPPPPAQSDGAFGFMKRTVNTVGSTLTNLGRGAMGN
jgi:hypothetical protein